MLAITDRTLMHRVQNDPVHHTDPLPAGQRFPLGRRSQLMLRALWEQRPGYPALQMRWFLIQEEQTAPALCALSLDQ